MPPHSLSNRAFARVIAIGSIACALASCASNPLPQPAQAIRATDDPEIIARGRYLAYGPAHCASCHGDPARQDDLLRGVEIPLSGGRRFDLGVLGSIVVPNITADPIAGIGALSDDTLVRALRYGISHSGRPLIPFMPFSGMADRDLQAVISFLRMVQPVRGVVPPGDLSWLGSLAVRVMLKPQSPVVPPPAEVPPQRSAEYGRYLAHTVANCHGCHTRRSRLTGAFVGPPFAGGMKMVEPGGTFITPNLTTATDGILRTLDERQFVERFRMRARTPTHSPMPWTAFARMTDDDLGAIYLYLRSLQPAPMPSA